MRPPVRDSVPVKILVSSLIAGAQMVPFAGYALPVQYPDGVLSSHLRTRQAGCASLFDVGHMGQIRWRGRDRARFLEKLVVADVADIKSSEAKLTLITNERGGIIDDSVITNHGDYMCAFFDARRDSGCG